MDVDWSWLSFFCGVVAGTAVLWVIGVATAAGRSSDAEDEQGRERWR